MRPFSTWKLTRSTSGLIFALAAWLVIVGLFLLIRLYGSNDRIDWAAWWRAEFT